MSKLINGKEFADKLCKKIAEEVKKLKDKNITPGLAVIRVGEDPASTVYINMKAKKTEEVGMHSVTKILDEKTSQNDLLNIVEELNKDESINGILVQLPLPEQINEDSVINAINPDKDVDGLHPLNGGRLIGGTPRFLPATPAGVQQMLQRSGFSPDGKQVAICGRSNIVGKPLAVLLMQKGNAANATVTVCHTGTSNLAEITRRADIVIAAIGRPRMITADMLKDGAVVIDVGINRVEDPETKSGYRLVGDVDFGPASEKVAAITPVPGGVGPMTIACLLKNTIECFKRSQII